MAEKRNLGRHRKRFTLRFGNGEPVKMGFTEDISTTGLFIKSAYVCNTGSVISVELALEKERKVLLEARVMWAKKVPPQMIHLVKKCGMGVNIIRFISGESDYCQLCEELSLPLAELL
jgi:PilZ domain